MKETPSPPNQLLRAERLRRHWSQQMLADRLGTTPVTISRWERGLTTPGPYLRSQLYTLFGESLQALGGYPAARDAAPRQPTQPGIDPQLPAAQGERSLPLWMVPFRRNPFFTGREDLLTRLSQTLHASKAAALTQALSGLGGIGKTQTAIEYAYRFATHYQAVLWASAETRAGLLSAFASIAEHLGLLEQGDHDQQHLVEAVHQWLGAHTEWLLILDNVEDLSLLQEMLPLRLGGHLLLTTRTQVTGVFAHGLHLEQMEPAEGALLLLRRAKYLPLGTSLEEATEPLRASALEIAELLGGLPLALDQAGAYLEETGCSLAHYLDCYRTRRAYILSHRGAGTADHPASVMTTFSLAFEQAAEVEPAATDLLRLCAFLAPDGIPETLLREGAAELGAPLAQVVTDPLALDATITVLRRLSLLRRQAETETLVLHRLVQAVLKDQMDRATERAWAERAVRVVNRGFPDSAEEASWAVCQRYLASAQACADLITEWQIHSRAAGPLLTKLGAYLQERAQYPQAEAALTQARGLLEQVVGGSDLDLAHCLNELALVYHYQGKYAQAEPLYQQALQIREQQLGPTHPTVSESLINLGGLYFNQGKFAEAEPLFQRALALREQTFGPAHLFVATSLNNLGGFYQSQGQYLQAEPFFQRSLAIRQQELGETHPRTALTLSNLANCYVGQGKYKAAAALHQQALAIREQVEGPAHASVGASLHDLARLAHKQGQLAQAEPLYQRALDIREHALGATHPRTLETLSALAQLSLEQDNDALAESLCLRTLTMQEQILGTTHPNVAESCVTLARLYSRHGVYAEAEPLYRRALAIWEQALGQDHPLTASCRQEYDALPTREDASRSPQGSAPHKAADARGSPNSHHEGNPLHGFVAAYCDLHPRAWSRARDLWNAYQAWVREQEEPFPLTRRAFVQALQAQGCQAARTNTSRIWRGIALQKREHEPVTSGDRR